jgi:hypothetical protein
LSTTKLAERGLGVKSLHPSGRGPRGDFPGMD